MAPLDGAGGSYATLDMGKTLPDDVAYSLLEVKSVNEQSRKIRGIATTPSTDRMGDIVEPMGVKFKNPMPLLWMHKSDKPVGIATFSKATAKGIEFEATIPNVVEQGVLKDRVDEAWQSIQHNLVKGVSIGFRPIEYSFIDDGGIRFIETEVMELSLVTIPANSDCSLSLVKSIDAETRAANGNARPADPQPGATGNRKSPVQRTVPLSTTGKKTISEQIAAFEATRAAKAARIQEVQENAIEEGRTKNEAEREEFETIERDLGSIDQELVDLRRLEKMNLQTLRPVDGSDPVQASQSRAGSGLVLPTVAAVAKGPKLPPGIGFTRYVMALHLSKGNLMMAERIAAHNDRWNNETPQVVDVIRSAINAGTTTDTTWASPLVPYQNLQQEFIEYLRPLTIIGRIPGLRRVPFKVKIPRQTGAATVGWVGEGKIKPLSQLAFDTVTLEIAKIAGIVVLTDELVRESSPSAEMLVRDELAAAIVQYMDSQFVDPTKASNDVSPASITYGVTPVTATGTTASALRQDVRSLMATFLQANNQLGSAVWIMTQETALGISLMMNTLGQPEFSGISMQGGTFLGIPVVTSEGVPATGGSPTDGYAIILANANDILLADDGQVTIDASREATLQMDSAPDSPETASTISISMWQHNMMAVKAERYINWTKRRSTCVGFIQNAKYAE
jgi:HK97 family phage major capsid protein/HK97 family phage prohead protease